MKKLFVLISAALLLIGLSACQQEIQSSEVSGETVTATFDVSIPSALKTKAYGDASGLTKVNYEIWDSEFTGLVSKGEVELDENLSGTLSLKLIRFKSYSVLFWAQGAAAKHEWTDLRTINIDYTPNIENDAFAGRVLNIDATNDQNLEGSVILERPFAQINFATDDLGAGKGVNVGDLTLKSATVTVPGLATTYDGTTGKSSATAEAIEFKSTAVMAEPFVMNQVEYDHLLVFYPLMADGASENVDIAAEFVATTASGQDVTVSWTGKGAMNNVPVKANNRTNFYGSIFTAFGDLDVSVDDDFTTVVDPSLNFESKTISDLLASTTGNGTYLIEGTITAVAPNAADENKEDVTFMDASGAELTVALLKEDADLIVKSLGTYYQVGDAIKVIVEKNGENVSASEVIAHKRDVADIYLDIKDAEGTEPVTVTLAASEVLNHGPIVVAEGQNVILDLTNNAVLSNGRNFWDEELKYWSLISVQGGTLTIRGEGALQAAADDCYAVDVRNGGKLVIEGGKFVGNISAVYVHEGTVEIKGGEFSIQQKSSYNDSRFLLNCLDENYTAGKAKISVTGGTFAGFNPQDNLAEGESTDFVAEGYAATHDNTADTYTVSEKQAKAVTVQEFIAAEEDDELYILTGTIVAIDYINTRGKFTIEDETGEVLIYNMLAAEGGTPLADLGLTLGDLITVEGNRGSYNGTAQMTNGVYVSHEDKEAPAIVITDATIPEFIAAEVSTDLYRVTGTIVNVSISAQYGNADITIEDEDGNSLLIYRMVAAEGGTALDQLGLTLGDELTVVGERGEFNDKAQMVNGYYESHVDKEAPTITIIDATITEFLAASVSSSQWYRVTGKIIGINISTQYGNADITIEDEDGNSLLIFRMVAAEGGTALEQLGLNINDILTVVGNRGEFNGAAQMVEGYYESHVDKEAPADPNEGKTALYSVDFESADFTATSTYNNSEIATFGPENQRWNTIFGTVSTTSPLAGTKSMQMRKYTNKDTNGYCEMNFDIENASEISFSAAKTGNNSVLVQYSTDSGSTWSAGETFELTTTAQTYTYDLGTTVQKVRFKFTLVPPATPDNSTTRLYIDDINIY